MLRQTILTITWDDEQCPKLINSEEWHYIISVGGVVVDRVHVNEDYPTDMTLDQLIERENDEDRRLRS